MIKRIPITTLIVALLTGCASVDGTYSPDCIAYAGDTVVFADGRFTWDRFTDAIPVDDAGNAVDPTPGYPMQGTYKIEGDTVHLTTDQDDNGITVYLREHDGAIYLLTAEQAEALKNTGTMADCALAKGGHGQDPEN